MDTRGHESPMEWEYQNGGPVDESSPFVKHTMSHRQNQADGGAKKRGFSVFDSPIKTSTPALREPASQTFLFSNRPSSPIKPLPAFRNPSFTTPRKFETELLSSGAENPSSPDNADNEETPEAPPTRAPVTFFSSRAEKKQPVFGKYGFAGSSPGRGEITRGSYSNAIAKRVQKRRRREIDRQLSRRNSQDDDSDGDSGRPGTGDGNNGSIGPGYAYNPTFFEAHPHLPDIMLKWAQMLFNTLLCGMMLYFLWSCYSTIRADVDKKAEEAKEDVLMEMRRCAENFVQNRCSRQDRVPAMETVCENWEKCMNMNPDKVGRAKISAHTWAEILNSFLEPFSIRSIIVIVGTIVAIFSTGNFALVRARREWQPNHMAPPPPPQAPQMHPHDQYPPQTPGGGYYAPYVGAPASSSMQPQQLEWRSPSKHRGGGYH